MWSEIFCDVLFEPEERPPQSNKTQDASLPRDAVSALVFHICDIWKLWGADALYMSNDHLASSVKVGCIEDGRNSCGRFEEQSRITAFAFSGG